MILPQDTDLNFASIAQLFSQADGPIVLVFFSAVVEIELLDDERVNSDTSCTRYSSDIIPLNGLDAELIIYYRSNGNNNKLKEAQGHDGYIIYIYTSTSKPKKFTSSYFFGQ